MLKRSFLLEVAKGCQKTNGIEGDLSFFTIDEKGKAIETNRYKSGYIVPHFSTLSFIEQEVFQFIRQVTSVLDYEHAALLFSETHRKKGVRPHIHIPTTELPTVTFAKVFYRDQDPTYFNFYEQVDPTGTVIVPDEILRLKHHIACEEDAFFIFDSSTTPHEVEVKTDSTSLTGYFFFEKVRNADDAMRVLNHKFYDLRSMGY